MSKTKNHFLRLLPINHHPSTITLFAILLLAACNPPPRQISREFLALGTVVSITVIDANPQRAEEAIGAARIELTRLGKDWYAWAPDGELARLNAALSKGERFAASAELAGILMQAQKFFAVSGGAFDPAVGSLVQRWGFQAGERPVDQAPPTDMELDAWRADHPTFSDLQIDGTAIDSRRRDLFIDLGAIGKGAAVDRLFEQFRARGIEHALINAGGNLRALGNNKGTAWRVAIRDPDGGAPIGWLDVKDGESVSSSGDYERFAIVKGQRIHHLLDPRTGRSVTHTRAITVLAKDATLADAASTALFVAGPDGWRALAHKLGVDYVLRIAADGSLATTEPMLSRLQMESPRANGTETVAP